MASVFSSGFSASFGAEIPCVDETSFGVATPDSDVGVSGVSILYKPGTYILAALPDLVFFR